MTNEYWLPVPAYEELYHVSNFGRAKLTSEQVLYVRENPDGLNAYQLADKFNVNQATISKIQLGKTYKNAGGKIRQTQKK